MEDLRAATSMQRPSTSLALDLGFSRLGPGLNNGSVVKVAFPRPYRLVQACEQAAWYSPSWRPLTLQT